VDLPFPEFVAAAIALYSGPAYARATLQAMERVLYQVERLQPHGTADLTTAFAAKLVALRSSEVSPNTIRGELSRFRALCNFAIEEGWLERAPRWKRVRPRAVPSKTKRLHSIAEVARVLELLRGRRSDWESHRLYALVAVAACTGARRNELLRIHVEDVRADRGVILISSRQRLKTEASAAPVPICPMLEEILREWLPRTGSEWLFPGVKRFGPWTGGTASKCPLGRLKAVGEDLGIEGLTWQSLRHTFATWARRRWGLSGIQLRDVLRHTTEHTQEHYVHDELDTCELVKSVQWVRYE